MKKIRIILLFIIILSSFDLLIGDDKNDRPKIGVVLSGGGARGIAHIGILQVLDELNIPIDIIGGTSFGALVAAFYASGYTPVEIEDFISKFDWQQAFSGINNRQSYYYYTRKRSDASLLRFKFKNWRLQLPSSLTSSQTVLNKLSLYFTRPNYLCDGNFIELPTPLIISTTDIINGKNKIFTKGNLIKILQASLSVPFLFPPVKIDTSLYVDGGVTNNLPISAMKNRGADIIIASNTTNYLHSRKNLESPLSVAEQLINIMMFSKIKNELKKADIVLRPDTKNIPNTDFSRWKEILEAGKKSVWRNEEYLSNLAIKTINNPKNIDKYSMNQISISGNTIFTKKELLSNFKKDSTYILKRIKKNIIKKYFEKGYILVKINTSEKIGNKIPLKIEEGLISKISISGNELTKSNVIYRELKSKSGDIFNINIILEDINRIYATDYFESVTFSIFKNEDNSIDLEFSVEEKAYGIIEVGANYNTEESSSAFLSVGHENIFGLGSAANLYMRYGVERKFGLKLITDRILKFHINSSFEFFLKDNTKNTKDRYWNILAEIGFFDDKRLGALLLIFDYRISNLKNQNTSTGIGVKMLFDSYNKFPYPETGLYRNSSFKYFDKLFGSEFNFNQYTFINKFYLTPLKNLTFSNEINLIINNSRNGTIPYNRIIHKRPDKTFYGYRYNEVSGDDLFYISAQLRLCLREFSFSDPRKKLYLVGRAGIGQFGQINSMDNYWEIFEKCKHLGYNIGFEMSTIFGPVKLLYEISRTSNFWNFSIGYNF